MPIVLISIIVLIIATYSNRAIARTVYLYMYTLITVNLTTFGM